MALRQSSHSADELRHFDASQMVVLNSGSGLMSVECVEGDKAVVRAAEGQRVALPIACLSKLVPVTKEELNGWVPD